MVELEAPTIGKVIEEGVLTLFYYHEINILSIFSLKQSDFLAVELQTTKTTSKVIKHMC